MDTTMFELPGGIRVDEGELAREVELREMSGEEEDILTDQRKEKDGSGKSVVHPSQRITNVLARCTVRLGTKCRPENLDPLKASERHFQSEWGKLAYSGDRGFAIIQLRRLSLGDSYVFSDVCPGCRRQIPRLEIDLSTLKTFSFFRNLTVEGESGPVLDEEAVRQALLLPQHDVTLPSGRRVTYKMLQAPDEIRISDAIVTESDLATAALVMQVVGIDGTPSTYKMLKALSSRDRTFLRNHLDIVTGGLETNVEVTCPNPHCGMTFSRQLDPGQRSFFFPSAT